MFIETTFIGHGPGGLIGITLNEKAVQRWAMSLYICSRLMKDVADLKDPHQWRSPPIKKS